MLDDATSKQKYFTEGNVPSQRSYQLDLWKIFCKTTHVKAPQSHDCLKGWKWVQNYTSEADIENCKLAY